MRPIIVAGMVLSLGGAGALAGQVVPAYGPDLADAIWWHGPGSYEWLVREVSHGIPENLTVTGEPMPARGQAAMNEQDVRAVAAYIWAISHPPKPPRPESGRSR